MKCFEFDLNSLFRITLLNKQKFTVEDTHITRTTPEYIIYFVLSGKLHLENAGEDIVLLPGDVYFFKKGDFQRPVENAECEYWYIHFENEPLNEIEVDEKEYASLVNEKKDVFKVLLRQKMHIFSEEVLNSIIAIFKNNKIQYISGTESRICASNATALALLRLESVGIKSNAVTNGMATVKKISEYIDKNFFKNITSADIEKEFLINYDYANRLFKKIKGKSIMEYKNTVRISTAKEKITVSAKSLSEIAFEVGFEDNCYFSRAFKKHEGVSPKEYREGILKNEVL